MKKEMMIQMTKIEKEVNREIMLTLELDVVNENNYKYIYYNNSYLYLLNKKVGLGQTDETIAFRPSHNLNLLISLIEIYNNLYLGNSKFNIIFNGNKIELTFVKGKDIIFENIEIDEQRQVVKTIFNFFIKHIIDEQLYNEYIKEINMM